MSGGWWAGAKSWLPGIVCSLSKETGARTETFSQLPHLPQPWKLTGGSEDVFPFGEASRTGIFWQAIWGDPNPGKKSPCRCVFFWGGTTFWLRLKGNQPEKPPNVCISVPVPSINSQKWRTSRRLEPADPSWGVSGTREVPNGAFGPASLQTAGIEPENQTAIRKQI